MTANFPTDANLEGVDSLEYANHAYTTGTFTGTINGVNFTVTFASGVPTVKETPAGT